MTRLAFLGPFIAAAVCVTTVSPADDLQRELDIIRGAGPNGKGSRSARRARDRIAEAGPDILPRLLVAMDTPNVIAANWYRSAFEEITNRELAAENPRLPLQFLKRFVRDGKRQGRVRRLSLALVEKLEPGFRDRLIPTLLGDPEFNGEAVATALKLGNQAQQAGKKDAARKDFEAAFRYARDSRQVIAAADRLKQLGVDVSIVKQMGFVTDWWLLGPFDAPGKSGFARQFPPEKNPSTIDLAQKYGGKSGKDISWKRFQTTDRLGQVNLIQAIAAVKEAAGFAYTEFDSASEQRVELRCGADDNLTVWLNGEKVFSRLQWLNGTRLDRFSAPATLKAGRNRLLVKICQGPQHNNPAVPNNWSLQLRFCDNSGAGADFTSRLPAVDSTSATP